MPFFLRARSDALLEPCAAAQASLHSRAPDGVAFRDAGVLMICRRRWRLELSRRSSRGSSIRTRRYRSHRM